MPYDVSLKKGQELLEGSDDDLPEMQRHETGGAREQTRYLRARTVRTFGHQGLPKSLQLDEDLGASGDPART